MNIFIAIFVLFTSLFTPKTALAQQSFTSQITQAESDYRYQFDLYRNSYQTYQVSKSEYLSSGTLKAEQEALTAAKQAATARAEVLRTYTAWLRLQILQFASSYDQSQAIAASLQDQNNWYLDHKSAVQAAGSPAAFETVMADYVAAQKNRTKLYSAAQIQLKLAQLSAYQHQARSLYDPLLKQLQNQTEIPEIEQGMAKIQTLGDQVNQGIIAASQIAGSIESEDLNLNQANSKAMEQLTQIQSNQLQLLTLMIELESRYAQ